MKPENNQRALITNGSQASTSFGISLADEAHLMGILREGLYTDRILAVLREYSANAWDAHRAAEVNRPIEVQIPTRDEPMFRVRDFGPGLSHDEMFQIFTQYGSSTKRDSDDVVGMLGIGSKSGFAYADTFTVISHHGGHKRTYVAALDESEKGTLTLLADEESDSTGIEIQIATKDDDWYKWQRKAEQLYRHFDPRPTINITLPDPPTESTKLVNGTIHGSGHGEWIAVMGCVPYRVNVEQLDQAFLPKCIPHMSGQLSFKIGDVAVSASREELKYTKATNSALVDRFTALVDEYVTKALKMLETAALTAWESRLRVRVLQAMELPLPEQWTENYGQAFVQIKYDDKSGFVVLHNSTVTTRITIDKDVTLWIDDVNKDLKGYDLGVDDYVVRSKTLDATALRAVLDRALVDSKLTGVKIALLSTKTWAEWRLPKKKVSNPKHRAKMFKYTGSRIRDEAFSESWDAVTREPEDTDVFVLLEAFKPGGSEHWFATHKTAVTLVEYLGETMPEIHGYKITEKKPVDELKLSGQSWGAWLKALRERVTLKIISEGNAEQYFWAELTSDYGDPTRELRCLSKRDYDRVVSDLGVGHPISQVLTKCRVAQDKQSRTVIEVIGLLRSVDSAHPFGDWAKSEAKREIDAMLKQYPLLKEGIQRLWSNGDETKAKHWRDYARLIDARDQLQLLVMPSSPAQLKVVP